MVNYQTLFYYCHYFPFISNSFINIKQVSHNYQTLKYFLFDLYSVYLTLKYQGSTDTKSVLMALTLRI